MGFRRAALLAVCTASCAYPEFAFTPTDAVVDDTALDTGLADTGARDTGTVDTTVEDVPDTTVVDTASSDTFMPDTFLPDTFLPDTFMPDTKPLGFCASSSHFYCNDLDASTEVTYGWTGPYSVGSGALKLDSTAKSAPRSLRSTLTAPSSEAFDAATLGRVVEAPTAGAVTRYEADIMLDTATYTGVEGALLMKLQRTGGSGVGIGIGPGGLYLEIVGATYTWRQLTTKPAAGTWFHLKVETKLLISGGSVKVWINDVLDQDLPSLSTINSEVTTRSIVVGLYADAPIVTFGARFDNVTVDFP